MILYLHGLNSAGSSHKGRLLREGLAPIPVDCPTYPVQLADQAVAKLNGVVQQALVESTRRKQPLLLVGSSMGGFYGQYLARQHPVDQLVMINPALRPWDLLRQVVGWQYNEALDERYYLSEAMVEATRRYGIDRVDDGVPTTLLLDQGDELIDWRIAAAIYQGIGTTHSFSGGSHAFEHMPEAIGIIRRLHQDRSSTSPR